MDRLAAADVVRRLWDGDHTVVQDDPTECADRLGWLHVIEDSQRQWPRWALFADEAVDGAGDHAVGELHDVIVLGMGGSSLFPEVLATTFESGEGFPRLRILDTTAPDAVARVLESTDPEHTLVVVSSKSGSTIETRSQLELFWQRAPVGAHYVAITDPGSALEQLATERNFRSVVHGVPEIGGRFSALSAFGMLPAALLGIDGAALLDTAEEAAAVLGPETPVSHHLGCQLGAFMAVAALAGRDKLTFHIDERLAGFGAWLEQLIAESTGKHGVGILPVLGDPGDSPAPEVRAHVLIGEVDLDPAELDGPCVLLPIEEPQDLGAQVFLWEFATTVAGIVLGINPFDQPDVEAAKRAARQVLEEPDAAEVEESSLEEALAEVRPGDAIVLAAFADPALGDSLGAARRALSEQSSAVTTLGIGPRFLHSTGQLHKGAPARIVVVQVVQTPTTDLAIPGSPHTFGQLFRAQADGDLAALRAAGCRAARVPLEQVLGLL